jgi:hypothetical protein
LLYGKNCVKLAGFIKQKNIYVMNWPCLVQGSNTLVKCVSKTVGNFAPLSHLPWPLGRCDRDRIISCRPRWPRQVPSLSVISRCRWCYCAKLRQWKHGYNHSLDSWALCWGLGSNLARIQFAHWQADWLARMKSEGLAEDRQAGWLADWQIGRLADWQGSRQRGRQVGRQVGHQNVSQNCQNQYNGNTRLA